jgi:hypothetical protein
MSILGVNMAGSTAWFALMDSDARVAETPDRFTLSNRPRTEALHHALEDLERLCQRHDVRDVVVVDAHGNVAPRSYQQARPRICLEVLIELAAASAGSQFRVLSPSRIKGVLGLASQRLIDHLDRVPKAGVHWDKRGPAALAALAAMREGN